MIVQVKGMSLIVERRTIEAIELVPAEILDFRCLPFANAVGIQLGDQFARRVHVRSWFASVLPCTQEAPIAADHQGHHTIPRIQIIHYSLITFMNESP